MNPDRINMDLILEILQLIDSSAQFSDVTGAVLVFMPGFAQIQELYDLLRSDRNFSNSSRYRYCCSPTCFFIVCWVFLVLRYRIIALHSVLSSADQSAAFTVPPEGTRKIVIATNIAETGITIPDVAFVIDSGKAKENRFELDISGTEL